MIRLKLGEPALIPEVLERLRGFAEIEGIEQAFVGENLRGDDYDVGAIFIMRDEAAYRAYAYDPIHLEMDRFSRPHLAGAQIITLGDGEAPDLPEKLLAWGEVRERDPELRFSEITKFEIKS